MRNLPGFPMARDAPWHDPRRGQIHAVWWPDGQLDGFGLGAIPKHCRYRPGDWVVMHGYPGAAHQIQRDGFRGIVLGHMGSTILRGLTDDGREWSEHWGHLDPDGTPGDSTVLCVCCPHPPRRRPPEGEQISMFDLLAAVSADV